MHQIPEGKDNLLKEAEILSAEVDNYLKSAVANNEDINQGEYILFKDISEIAKKYLEDHSADEISLKKVLQTYWALFDTRPVIYVNFLSDILSEKGVSSRLIDAYLSDMLAENQKISIDELYHYAVKIMGN